MTSDLFELTSTYCSHYNTKDFLTMNTTKDSEGTKCCQAQSQNPRPIPRTNNFNINPASTSECLEGVQQVDTQRCATYQGAALPGAAPALRSGHSPAELAVLQAGQLPAGLQAYSLARPPKTQILIIVSADHWSSSENKRVVWVECSQTARTTP